MRGLHQIFRIYGKFMNIIQTWYLLLKKTWARKVIGICFIFLLLLLFPGTWSGINAMSGRTGYMAGLIARLTATIFWKHVSIIIFVIFVVE